MQNRVLLLGLSCLFSFFHASVLAHSNSVIHRPESHAPAGVMADHLHKAGEWMIGIRTMSREFSGLYEGSDPSSNTEAATAGFSMVATDMTMHMLMLDIMYALNDDVTLMFMPQYMEMDMTMTSVGGMMMGGMHMGHSGGTHEHSVSGVGDTILAALMRLHKTGHHDFHATLGISVPTGSVDERMASGMFTHYGMQLGTGTWDFLPSVTYTGHQGVHSWGSQLGASLPTESANDSGFAFGERYFASGWYAYRATQSLSVSTRVMYEKEGRIQGQYNGPAPTRSPADFQENYGGEFVDVGLGINTVIQSGGLSGFRAGIEWMIPVSEHYNGFQLGRDQALNVSLSRAY